jgi:hypothetical protein
MAFWGKALGWIVNTTAQALAGAIFLALLAGGSVAVLVKGVSPTVTAASAGVLTAVAIFVAVIALNAIATARSQVAIVRATAPDTGPPMARTQYGDRPVAAVGIFRLISIRYIQPGNQSKFRCCVYVDFYGLTGNGQASPIELRLTTPNAEHELARLEIPQGTDLTLPTAIKYCGEGDWDALMVAVAKTMTLEPSKTRPMPWTQMPPGDSLYCNVEIRLPNGKPGIDHPASLVRLSFEIAGGDHKRALIRIDPWSTLSHPPGETMTYL